MAVFLTLGEVTFQNFEIPEQINFGGSQMLSVQKLIGGQRQIDGMGRDDDDITWSGLLQGAFASFRASFLDGMRVSGKAVPLFWSQFNYMVVIKEFKAVFRRFYWIDYTITCTVVQDLNKPFTILLPNAYNDIINNAMAEANDLALVIKNPGISSSIALLSETINSIASLENATASVLAGIAGPLASALDATKNAISSTSSGLFP